MRKHYNIRTLVSEQSEFVSMDICDGEWRKKFNIWIVKW